MSWMRPGGLMRPWPSSSNAIVLGVVRLPRPFAARPGCSAAGGPALYAGLLACGCHFAVVPNGGTVHRTMHSFRCGPGSRPIRLPTVPLPNAAQADVARTHTSYQAPVHSGSYTTCQPLARADRKSVV